MKAAFTLFLVALMILPAVAMARIRLRRAMKRKQEESEPGGLG
ncbi:MAG: hypothetical protein JWO81_1302 [Alphaproteobacteria bacterium]|nr:hypothetical protein [Alphaproteobacteria bacterium]